MTTHKHYSDGSFDFPSNEMEDICPHYLKRSNTWGWDNTLFSLKRKESLRFDEKQTCCHMQWYWNGKLVKNKRGMCIVSLKNGFHEELSKTLRQLLREYVRAYSSSGLIRVGSWSSVSTRIEYIIQTCWSLLAIHDNNKSFRSPQNTTNSLNRREFIWFRTLFRFFRFISVYFAFQLISQYAFSVWQLSAYVF